MRFPLNAYFGIVISAAFCPRLLRPSDHYSGRYLSMAVASDPFQHSARFWATKMDFRITPVPSLASCKRARGLRHEFLRSTNADVHWRERCGCRRLCRPNTVSMIPSPISITSSSFTRSCQPKKKPAYRENRRKHPEQLFLLSTSSISGNGSSVRYRVINRSRKAGLSMPNFSREKSSASRVTCQKSA